MVDQLEKTGEKIQQIGTEKKVSYVTDESVRLKSAKEAYYQWISRLIILIAVLSLGFFMSASLVLFQMAPQVSVETFLVINQDSSDSMVRHEAISTDMPSSKQMMETFIKQYVMMRNIVINDTREMQSRWFPGGIINYLSAPAVYDAFFRTADATLTAFNKNKDVRDVEIIAIGKVGGEKSPVWKVDFRTYDLSPADVNSQTGQFVLKTRYWTASVTAFFMPQRVFMAKRLMNPLGFTVVRYSQTEVEIL